MGKRKPDAGQGGGECREQALRFLAFRDRSEREMREALQKKGYENNEITRVIDRLKKEKYIDDERYCKRWAGYRMESLPAGPLGLEADLRRKGFDDNLVRSVSDSIWRTYNEFEVAYQLVRKRYVKAGDSLSVADLRRVNSFLQRKGFSSEVAGRVISEFRK